MLIITEPAPVLPDLVGRSNPNSLRHGSRTPCFGVSASAAASPDPSDMVSLCIADGSPFLATAATAHLWKSVTSLQSWCDSSPTRCDALRQGCESSRSKCDQIPDKVRLISRQSATGLRVATPQSPDKVRTVSMDVTRRGRCRHGGTWNVAGADMRGARSGDRQAKSPNNGYFASCLETVTVNRAEHRTLSGDRYDEAGTQGVETSRGRAYNPITAETVRPRMQRFRAVPDLKPLPEESVPPRTIRP
ncbi:MAG: hypothetical protein EBT47_03525, partial [Chloroflexi bacterium]|nr:hypothetical protein [Chloroflexota bacterium]